MALQFPNINPVAVSLGPLKIRWYALAYLAGFLLGWRYVLYLIGLDQDRRDGVRRVEKVEIDDFMTWAILGVILGGRIGYVLFYDLGMYLQHPLQIFEVWQGGMSFHGGAMGVIIAMIVFAARRKIPVLRLTDLVCCAVPIGLFFGRVANFINGELFGRVTDAPWGMVFPNGGDLPRHPSQLYEAGLEGLTLFTILCVLAHREKIRSRPGIISGVFLIGYALCRITVENFRQPDAQLGFIFAAVTMGQILSVPMIIFGLVLIVRAFRVPQRGHDKAV
jgi:phosphatidylglycerol:prolipoprotein diacylglycerol transferase